MAHGPWVTQKPLIWLILLIQLIWLIKLIVFIKSIYQSIGNNFCWWNSINNIDWELLWSGVIEVPCINVLRSACLQWDVCSTMLRKITHWSLQFTCGGQSLSTGQSVCFTMLGSPCVAMLSVWTLISWLLTSHKFQEFWEKEALRKKTRTQCCFFGSYTEWRYQLDIFIMKDTNEET